MSSRRLATPNNKSFSDFEMTIRSLKKLPLENIDPNTAHNNLHFSQISDEIPHPLSARQLKTNNKENFVSPRMKTVPQKVVRLSRILKLQSQQSEKSELTNLDDMNPLTEDLASVKRSLHTEKLFNTEHNIMAQEKAIEMIINEKNKEIEFWKKKVSELEEKLQRNLALQGKVEFLIKENERLNDTILQKMNEINEWKFKVKEIENKIKEIPQANERTVFIKYAEALAERDKRIKKLLDEKKNFEKIIEAKDEEIEKLNSYINTTNDIDFLIIENEARMRRIQNQKRAAKEELRVYKLTTEMLDRERERDIIFLKFQLANMDNRIKEYQNTLLIQIKNLKDYLDKSKDPSAYLKRILEYFEREFQKINYDYLEAKAQYDQLKQSYSECPL